MKKYEPAVRLAGDGFVVPPGLAESLADAVQRLAMYPATVATYSKKGVPYVAGERLRLPDLSRTLVRIRDAGRDGFYRGETARLIAADMRANGGLVTAADLAAYEPQERPPVLGHYLGYEVISMPPPSSGGVALVQMLNILEGIDLAAMGAGSPQTLHYLAESMRRAFLDRARFLGDPDFTAVPVEKLTSKAYANSLRAGIAADRAGWSSPEQVAQDTESDETTHYSVVDASGMAVSVTYTLEAGYGLGAVVPGAGFLLNNEMGDFNGKPGLTDGAGLIGTPPNVARPGKRMLSSMTPTILAKDGRLIAVIGSPGGRTIINTVLQVSLNVMTFGLPIQEAVNAPRIHHQWLPDAITVERGRFPDATLDMLRAMGHTICLTARQGTAHSIMVDATTGVRIGAPDPRDRDAGASGH